MQSWHIVLTGVAAVFCLATQAVAQAQDGAKGATPAIRNPDCRPNELFPAFESFYSPRLAELRQRYQLDGVVKNEADEWKRMLLLRHWIHTHIRIENEHPTPTEDDAIAILDAALKGGGFHCAHFSRVQGAVLNSYGYVARRLGVGPGTMERGGHHGVNEVWVNKFAKWVLIDAKYDLHFEKDGVPLSALEIRDEVWKDNAKSVKQYFGLDGKTRSQTFPDWEVSAETYRWCSWETSTNYFTAMPASRSSVLVMLDDEYFRANTWYRDGKPHWAYKTPYMLATTQRRWIEWTPNVIASNVRVAGQNATVMLTSCTPNLRSYQIKIGNASWADCNEQVELAVKPEAYRVSFRSVNLFGVTGPEHQVQIGAPAAAAGAKVN